MKREAIFWGTKKREILLSRIMLKCVAALTFFNFILSTDLLAQEQISAKKKDIDEIRLKLNDDGSHYLKLTLLGQLWFRYNQSNPGTTVLKEPTAETYDIGIPRAPAQCYGQLTDH